jgi:uncharacterized protein (TIGR02594 family)
MQSNLVLFDFEKAFIIALGEKGITETSGPKSTERILEYHLTTTLRATSDDVPWCSAFVNWCIQKAGGKGTGSALARSWLVWGIDAGLDPKQGDIVVLKRGNDDISGHVGFLAFAPSKFSPYIEVLGGNQNNMVCVKKYLRWNVLGYRRAIV